MKVNMTKVIQVALPSDKKKFRICQAKTRQTLNLKWKANMLLDWGLNKTLSFLICVIDEEVEQESVGRYPKWKVTVQRRSSA